MIINVILKAGLSWMSAILYCVELALVTVYIEITKLFSLDLTSSSDPPTPQIIGTDSRGSAVWAVS